MVFPSAFRSGVLFSPCERKTKRQAQTQTHRHTDTQTHTHTDTHTHTHTDTHTQTHTHTHTIAVKGAQAHIASMVFAG